MKAYFLALIGLWAIPSASEILEPLPEAASRKELRFQPYIDFDKDGCYNTAAIDANGRRNPGIMKSFSPSKNCRNKKQLLNSNVYSRKRCNHGYCAIMYEYYFEKDQATGLSGHKHDWENIVVFTKGDREVVRIAATEEHSKYRYTKDCVDWSDCPIPFEGERHAKLVYHKVRGDMHSFRFAKEEEGENGIEKAENHFHRFYKSPLVGWDDWPSDELRDKLVNWHDFTKPSIGGKRFGRALKKAAGSFKMVGEFNPFQERDEDEPIPDEDWDEDEE
ncbi:hypothetical protein FPOAC1_011467 [Fusarium poae]|uniref:hypothetical protein n=1 Tax=Fusarium poae TaxID=36050 RepID=UPI001CEB6961|nr:hypothetical protein FPOAC1_011467 [Fusarium poae]KAG8666657.1 hypothetical protein FPOAC1_011467 [Fusarium poae]